MRQTRQKQHDKYFGVGTSISLKPKVSVCLTLTEERIYGVF